MATKYEVAGLSVGCENRFLSIDRWTTEPTDQTNYNHHAI